MSSGFPCMQRIAVAPMAARATCLLENARGTRRTMIVALARKLLIALWRFVREGVVPEGIVLRPA